MGSPAEVYNNRPASLPASNVTSSNSPGYSRVVMHEGQVVSTQTGGPSIASTGDTKATQDAAVGTPYAHAVDAQTRCRIAPHELKEDSILYFPNGAEVTLAQARAMNYLPPGWQPNSTYPNRAQAQSGQENGKRFYDASAEQPTQETHPELAAEAFENNDAEQTLTTIVANVAGIEQMNAVKEIVENGEIGERTLSAIATQLQVEPSKLQEHFAPVMQAFKAQALAVMSQDGVDGSEVVAWAQQHNPDLLNRAMHQQATTRSTAGYAELRGSFLASLGETNPQRALQADLGPGITTFVDPKQGVMVRIPGYGDAMTWRSCIKAFGPK